MLWGGYAGNTGSVRRQREWNDTVDKAFIVFVRRLGQGRVGWRRIGQVG